MNEKKECLCKKRKKANLPTVCMTSKLSTGPFKTTEAYICRVTPPVTQRKREKKNRKRKRKRKPWTPQPKGKKEKATNTSFFTIFSSYMSPHRRLTDTLVEIVEKEEKKGNDDQTPSGSSSSAIEIILLEEVEPMLS